MQQVIRRSRFSHLRKRIARSSTLHALRFCLLLAGVLPALPGHAANTATVALAELAHPGRLLMLRHATAPGTGDPAHFRLEDCATQRNLDAGGRAQAAALGKRLARAGVPGARVYSSQWCRCLETARLLELGPVEPLPALNSFFGRPQQREATIAVLREFLAALPPGGPPIVLVTHQFTINAFTGEGTPSGGGSVFELNGTGAPRLLGAIESD
ncbi:MAG: histidine phosphatase family protein [Sulfuritalea sp.]|nr:histidine phosphatase family protein [Sulfuritalea sp.]